MIELRKKFLGLVCVIELRKKFLGLVCEVWSVIRFGSGYARRRFNQSPALVVVNEPSVAGFAK